MRTSSNDDIVEAVVVGQLPPPQALRHKKMGVKEVLIGTVNAARSIRTELVFGVWQMWFMLGVSVLFTWALCWFYLASAWNPIVSAVFLFQCATFPGRLIA
jgi:hypothetical protein